MKRRISFWHFICREEELLEKVQGGKNLSTGEEK